MTDRITGIQDQVLIQDDTSTEITDSLGWVQSSSHTVDNQMDSVASVTSGANRAYNIDGVARISGSLEFNINSLEALKLIGTLDTGSITFDDVLPTHTVKSNTDSSNHLEFTGVKFGSISLDISRGEPISLSADWMAKNITPTASTISATEPTAEPKQFLDVTVDIAGSTVGSVDSATIDYDRDLEARRGIESSTSGERRIATDLVEKLKTIDVTLTIEVTDQTAWTQAISTSSGIQDSRSDKSVTINLGSESLTLSGVRFSDVSEDKDNSKDVRTAEISGSALSMSASGI